jgi:Mg-chelatase subunit ChlI
MSIINMRIPALAPHCIDDVNLRSTSWTTTGWMCYWFGGHGVNAALKTAGPLAALDGRDKDGKEDIDRASQLALSHRVRYQPPVDGAQLRKRKQAETGRMDKIS